MNKIEISYARFLSFPALKNGVIHRHNGKLYKRSPESWAIVTAIEKYQKDPEFKSISVPKAYLFDKKVYFGYVMEYYKNLNKIKKAMELGIINDLEKYALELLSIIEKLNDLNMCYWDFHRGNILADEKGQPFIIDIDDINYLPSFEELHYQRQFLTEFLLNLYFDNNKSVASYPKIPIVQKCFSPKALAYLNKLGNLGENVPELPYCIIEELKDKEKRDMIKSKII